jgi:hypothetical protein
MESPDAVDTAEKVTATVTSVAGNLMCSLCGGDWSEHVPIAEGETSPLEGCIRSLGRRLAELEART